METALSRRNDAQDRALSFPSFSAKRRPKAAVQAFKDGIVLNLPISRSYA
jgi:hypothetical protein